VSSHADETFRLSWSMRRVPISLVLAWAVVAIVLLWAAVPGLFAG